MSLVADSDATRQLDRGPEPLDTYIRHPAPDPLRDGMSCCDIRAAEDDDKLLAAIPSDHIRMPQFRLDRRDDRAQTCIAGCMPECVIDLLEVIEIDEEECDRQSTRPGPQAAASRRSTRSVDSTRR